MNARIFLTGFVAMGALMGVVAGCGSPSPAPTHVVKIDVGGFVAWSGDATVALPNVTVTITDIDGDEHVATTSTDGLWVIENVKPGAYTERYELPGYETVEDSFLLQAGGENDVKNIFFSRGTVTMDETHLTATVTPYNLTLRDGDQWTDGLGGVVATYTTGTTIVVTFNRRIYNANAGSVYIQDDPSGDFAGSTVDSSGQVFTISAAAIAAIDGGLGPATDTDPFTWDLLLGIDVSSWTPIHGQLETMEAEVLMNATP